jgi:hypothetical protein
MYFPSSPFKFLCLSFSLIVSVPALSQNIGVNGSGNNPDPSAMLHVEAADKGLIIPRVQLNDTADAAPIGVAPAEGLMIYNETGTAQKGYYYWDAGKGQWLQVGTGAEDEDWTRDPVEGQMYPTNLGDSIGIGVQEPNAELDIRGRDVDLGSNRAAVKITDQSDGDTLYMDGDEISGGLGGGTGQEEALYLQLGTSEDLVMADGPALVGIGGAANYPNYKFDMTGGDARFKGSSENFLLFTDHSGDRVGVGTDAPGEDLHIADPDGDGHDAIRFGAGTPEAVIEGEDRYLDYRSGRYYDAHDFFCRGYHPVRIEWDRLTIRNQLADNNNNTGNVGYILTSTGGGVEWQDSLGIDGDWERDASNSDLYPTNMGDSVGIGTNAPDTKFHVYHDEPNTGVARFNNPNSEGFAGIYFDQGATLGRGWIGFVNPSSGFGGPDLMQVASGYTDMVFSTNGSGYYNEKMRIEVSGEVGIGYSAPAYMLAVNGDAYADDHLVPSDREYKTDIRSLEDPLEELLALEGVRYKWKKEAYPDRNFDEGEQIGLIAQDVEKVVPEVVKGGKDEGKKLGLAYNKLVPLLIEGVQEQQEQIDSLRNEVSRTRSELSEQKSLERIEKRNEALEAENEELRQKQKSLEKRLQRLEEKVGQDR